MILDPGMPRVKEECPYCANKNCVIYFFPYHNIANIYPISNRSTLLYFWLRIVKNLKKHFKLAAYAFFPQREGGGKLKRSFMDKIHMLFLSSVWEVGKVLTGKNT